jgi:hypothetical protein
MSVLTDRRLLDQLYARWGPVVHARDARSAGLPRGVLVRAVDRADLVRLGKAAFVRTSDWDAAGERERFRFRTLAFGLCLGRDAHLTGAGAALLLDLPLVDDPVGLPVAIRPGNAHTGHDRSPYGRVRHGYLPLTCRTERQRVPVVSPAFCAVDIARHLGPRDGLVVADAVLHSGVDREAVTRIAQNMLAYPGIQSVAWVAEHADRRVESPLESLCRYAFLAADRRPPLSNIWIGAGSRWFRVDHLLPDDGVVIEGDGALKYRDRPDADDHRPRREGTRAADPRARLRGGSLHLGRRDRASRSAAAPGRRGETTSPACTRPYRLASGPALDRPRWPEYGPEIIGRPARLNSARMKMARM